MSRSTLAPRSRSASRLRVPGSVYSPLGPIRVKQAPQEDCRGLYEAEDHTIHIDPTLSPEMKIQTVGHEIMHAIVFHHGLRHLINDKAEEVLCDAFGTWFAGAIQSGWVVLKEPQP